MKHDIDVLGCGVIYIDKERVFGSKPYGLFSTVNWKATDEDLKRIADRCLEVISDRKTEPSIDIEPKQGKWIDAEIPLECGGSMPIQVCNLCKTFYPLAYTGGGHRFCPNCGAKMKGASDDERRSKGVS